MEEELKSFDGCGAVRPQRSVDARAVRAFRLRAHHLDRRLPATDMCFAAAACGIQNSPPGAWETALFNRVEGCTNEAIADALYGRKSLLQAWSYRGAPVVFPTECAAVFLTALMARDDEQPWIYTRGVTGALEHVGMSFAEVFERVRTAALHLDGRVVVGKEALDRTLAAIVEKTLKPDARLLWRAPSMYGRPDRQTMGEAAVSFMLRPCSFSSLVVFGERQGQSPTFTSFATWTGRDPVEGFDSEAERELARRFVRSFGPTTVDAFASWLGSSPRQARRLWDAISEEMVPVRVEGRTRFLLASDIDDLCGGEEEGDRLLLLGAHDPYLDARDRSLLLPDEGLRKAVWKTVANPGVVLKGGRIIGVWKPKTARGSLDSSIALWEPIGGSESRELDRLVEAYASFRGLRVKRSAVEEQ